MGLFVGRPLPVRKMVGKRNNVIPNAHFHKDWKSHVRTWFNQPARKYRRRQKRLEKAKRIAPRPVAGLLRPVVRCPTVRYNTRERCGRGFTKQELKAASLSVNEARSLGIAFDPRRRNRCTGSIQVNVQRLKEYRSKLIIFPRKPNKPQKGDASEEERILATQLTGPLMPIQRITTKEKARKITADEKAFSAHAVVRQARLEKKYHGMKLKKAREAEEAKK